MSIRSDAVVVAALVLGFGGSVWAAPQFSVTPLQAPAGATSVAVGGFDPVSAAGYVVGRAVIGGQQRAVRWNAQGVPTLLAAPAGMTSSQAFGVNSAGLVVGIVDISGVGQKGATWDLFGNVTLSDDLISLQGVNDDGRALGLTSAGQSALVAANGQLTTLSNGSASTLTPYGGGLGATTGNSAAVWDTSGTRSTLSATIDGQTRQTSRAWAVNSSQQYVGQAQVQGSLYAVMWDGLIVSGTKLAMPAGFSAVGGQALDIDDDGRILGSSVRGGQRGVVWWDAAGTPRALDGLLTQGGWTLQNDYGFDANAYETLVLAEGRNAGVNGNAFTYVLLREVLTPTVTGGTNVRAATPGGGAGETGGVTVKFDESTGGTLSATYDDAFDGSGLPALPGTFTLGEGGQTQAWEVEFTGDIDGAITLTFGYDPSQLPAGDLADLRVLHLLGSGEWEELVPMFGPGNTLTVTTTELSPFVLAAVPEPGTLIVLGGLGLALVCRRRG